MLSLRMFPSNKRGLFFICGLIWIAVNLFVFYPSFFHPARADHIYYLAETADFEDLPSIINYSYSYPRCRIYGKGDTFLFRPLFYVFMSFEKWLFNFNVLYWQLTGFFLHLIIQCQLFRLFRRIKQHPASFLFILNFAVLLISLEMVIWHHVSGYLLFLIFILQALYHLLRYFQDGRSASNSFWIMAGYLMLACFTYEFGCVCLFVFMAVLFYNARRFPEKGRDDRKIWFLAAPLVLFLYVDFVDYYLRLGFPSIPGSSLHFNLKLVATFFKNIYFFSALFLKGTLFPALIEISPSDRLEMIHFSFADIISNATKYPYRGAANGVLLALVGAGAGYVIYRWRDFLKTFFQNKTHWLFMMAGINLALAILYVFFVTFGRLQQEGLSYMTNALYHFYIVGLFLTVACYGLFAIFMGGPLGNKRIGIFFVSSILLVSIGLNGYQARQLNREMKKRHGGRAALMRSLDTFVKKHKQERGFSFELVFHDTNQPKDLTFYFFRKYMAVEPKYYVIFTRAGGFEYRESEGEIQELLRNRGFIRKENGG